MHRLLSALVPLALALGIGCNRNDTKTAADSKNAAKDNRSVADAGPPIAVKAEDLFKEWKGDKAGANKKYQGKNLEIEGKLKTMTFANDKIMYGMDVGDLVSQIMCVMKDAESYKKAVPPQQVKIRGRWDEYGILGPQITDGEITSGGPSAAKEVSAQDLAGEYEKDKKGTLEKRKGQWLLVTGDIASKKKSDAGAPTFRLKGTGKTFVVASFTANDAALFNDLKEGQAVTVLGEVTDFNHEDDAIALFTCHLVKK